MAKRLEFGGDRITAAEPKRDALLEERAELLSAERARGVTNPDLADR